MSGKKSIIILGLMGLIGFSLIGCEDKAVQQEVEKHKATAEAKLKEAEEIGVQEWTPSQYEAAQAKYQNALEFAKNEKYEEARYEIEECYRLIEIAKNDTRQAKQKANQLARSHGQESLKTYNIERQQMLKDIQTLQDVVSDQKLQIDQQEVHSQELEVARQEMAEQAKAAREKAAAAAALAAEQANSNGELEVSGTSREYTVEEGDTLRTISGRPDIFNDPDQWVKIWRNNKDIMKTSRDIYPGQVIKIPES